MDIKRVLSEEIQNEVEDLSKMELGTDQYKATVDGITKLADRVIELERVSIESKDRVENRAIENDLKLKQIEDEQKDRRTKNLISAVSIGLPVVVTVWGTIVTLNFEKEGNVTTIMGRGFINKLLPKR
jgi:hypothetical protein|nr:MAG TPA: hypothetical protein [Herelleviridae sp.]